MFGNFADVQQAVGAGEDFDKRAEIRQANDFAEVGLADFGFRQQIANHLKSLVGGRFIGRGDFDATVILNVNLYAGLFDDAANDLSAGSDQLTDARRIDLHRIDVRSVGGNIVAVGIEGFKHLAENVE